MSVCFRLDENGRCNPPKMSNPLPFIWIIVVTLILSVYSWFNFVKPLNELNDRIGDIIASGGNVVSS